MTIAVAMTHSIGFRNEQPALPGTAEVLGLGVAFGSARRIRRRVWR